MISDFRLALRSLARTPGFTAVIVLTLALGIGANAAIFSFFHGILLRPLPYHEPERIVLVKNRARDYSEPFGVEIGLFAVDFRELQPQARSLQAMTAYTLDSTTLTGRGPADLARAAIVSPNFFSLLGSRAAFGRTFAADEPGGAGGRLATVSHGYWQSRLGGDPAILGQTVWLNHIAFTIVGVMPPDFDFPREADFWVTPAGDVPETAIGIADDFAGRGNSLRTILGRLQPGVSVEQAEAELSNLVENLPNPNRLERSVHLVTMRDQSVGNVRPALAVLLGCVGLVLLIACLNVANLMLSRAIEREREIGLRLAMGARRWRIARQLLSESVVLALLGGTVGVLLSLWTLDVLVSLAPDDIPRLAVVRVDGWVLGFALVVSLLTGIASGLAPILGTARSDLVASIKNGDRSGSVTPASRRLRSGLVAGEVAISLVLLVAAGLLVRSLDRMQAFSWGFDPTQVVTARVAFLDERYGSEPSRVVFYRKLLEKLEAVPGFEAVGMSLDRVGQTWIHLPFTAEGHVYASPSERPLANYHIVSPGYLRAMGVTLLQGRAFTEHDEAGSEPVVIVDAALARRFFPDGQAVGHRIALAGRAGELAVQIVGVAASVQSDGPVGAGAARPDLYIPFLQVPVNNFYVHVRTPVQVGAVVSTLKQAIENIDADVPVSDAAAMEQVTTRPARARQFPLGLLGAFAGLALMLATVGIYAVTTYAVAQRTREIGVRMALGAAPRSVIRLVLQQGSRPIALGLIGGLAGAAATAFAMRRLLYEIAPLDVPTFVAVPLLLAAIALGACLLPARRATQVDPLVALRAE